MFLYIGLSAAVIVAATDPPASITDGYMQEDAVAGPSTSVKASGATIQIQGQTAALSRAMFVSSILEEFLDSATRGTTISDAESQPGLQFPTDLTFAGDQHTASSPAPKPQIFGIYRHEKQSQVSDREKELFLHKLVSEVEAEDDIGSDLDDDDTCSHCACQSEYSECIQCCHSDDEDDDCITLSDDDSVNECSYCKDDDNSLCSHSDDNDEGQNFLSDDSDVVQCAHCQGDSMKPCDHSVDEARGHSPHSHGKMMVESSSFEDAPCDHELDEDDLGLRAHLQLGQNR